MNVLDPVEYYLHSERTEVEWPAPTVPVDLSLPEELSQEPRFSIQEWSQRGLAANYEGALFQPLLSCDNIAWLWSETDKIFKLSPRGQHGLSYIYNVAKNGYSSNLGEYFLGLVLLLFEYNSVCVSAEIIPTTYRNVALESRLYLPAIIVIHEWLLSKNFL